MNNKRKHEDNVIPVAKQKRQENSFISLITFFCGSELQAKQLFLNVFDFFQISCTCKDMKRLLNPLFKKGENYISLFHKSPSFYQRETILEFGYYDLFERLKFSPFKLQCERGQSITFFNIGFKAWNKEAEKSQKRLIEEQLKMFKTANERDQIIFNRGLLQNVVAKNNFTILLWLLTEKKILDLFTKGINLLQFTNQSDNLSFLTLVASQNGSVEILKYLLNLGIKLHANCVEDAIHFNQLEILKFLSGETYADELLLCQPQLPVSMNNHDFLKTAVKQKNIKLVKWLSEKNAPCNHLILNEVFAVYFPYESDKSLFEIIDQLLKCYPELMKHLAGYACKFKWLKYLQLADKNGFVSDPSILDTAINHGAISCIEWLVKEKKFPLKEEHSVLSGPTATSNDLPLFKCLISLGCPLDSTLNFMNFGDLQEKLLSWLKSEKIYPKDKCYTYFASKHGVVKLLDYLLKNGCEIDYEQCQEIATEYNNQNIIMYIFNITKKLDVKLTKIATEKSHLKLLKYLLKNKCELHPQCLEIAKSQPFRKSRKDINRRGSYVYEFLLDHLKTQETSDESD